MYVSGLLEFSDMNLQSFEFGNYVEVGIMNRSRCSVLHIGDERRKDLSLEPSSSETKRVQLRGKDLGST